MFYACFTLIGNLEGEIFFRPNLMKSSVNETRLNGTVVRLLTECWEARAPEFNSMLGLIWGSITQDWQL